MSSVTLRQVVNQPLSRKPGRVEAQLCVRVDYDAAVYLLPCPGSPSTRLNRYVVPSHIALRELRKRVTVQRKILISYESLHLTLESRLLS